MPAPTIKYEKQTSIDSFQEIELVLVDEIQDTNTPNSVDKNTIVEELLKVVHGHQVNKEHGTHRIQVSPQKSMYCEIQQIRQVQDSTTPLIEQRFICNEETSGSLENGQSSKSAFRIYDVVAKSYSSSTTGYIPLQDNPNTPWVESAIVSVYEFVQNTDRS